MGLCEVCHGELPVFFKAWIAVLGQCFVPVPNFIALCRVTTSFVIEANFNNAVNVAQALGQFEIWMAVQAPLKAGDDLVFVQANTPRSSYRQNEGPAKFFLVSGIQFVNFFKLFCGAVLVVNHQLDTLAGRNFQLGGLKLMVLDDQPYFRLGRQGTARKHAD